MKPGPYRHYRTSHRRPLLHRLRQPLRQHQPDKLLPLKARLKQVVDAGQKVCRKKPKRHLGVQLLRLKVNGAVLVRLNLQEAAVVKQLVKRAVAGRRKKHTAVQPVANHKGPLQKVFDRAVKMAQGKVRQLRPMRVKQVRPVVHHFRHGPKYLLPLLKQHRLHPPERQLPAPLQRLLHPPAVDVPRQPVRRRRKHQQVGTRRRKRKRPHIQVHLRRLLARQKKVKLYRVQPYGVPVPRKPFKLRHLRRLNPLVRPVVKQPPLHRKLKPKPLSHKAKCVKKRPYPLQHMAVKQVRVYKRPF